ncbi:DUF4163 domain-containing protein [Sphingobium sp. CAP-1]|uniref:DUF4163 domain-containing protein n=1 Tax=Sphingobium sp. CAP-1 TaxID=2676077 RepID=UPI0012BB3179|nr:DUF4163 domain-containing protein [Sphingobium sp. CAP-1]QGP78131.1 DUF4163 domain-containing protein [Sphingobium sp. CAP-1]
MQGRGLVVAASLLLAACSPHQDQQGNAAANAAASRFVDRMAGAPQPPPAASPFAESEKGAFLEFAYAYPAQAAAIPALVEKFNKQRTTAKGDALKMAKADSVAAKAAGFPFRPHSLDMKWTVAADTPRFLSLESESYVYTGGAHGMTGYDGVIWDRARDRETSVKALMTAPGAFALAIRDRFCKELDRQRAEKRGAAVVPGDDDFTKCIDPMEQLIVPTSSDGKLIDGMTVVIGPYSAGPYAEGRYDVALPVDTAMRKAIKTEYQDGFVAP